MLLIHCQYKLGQRRAVCKRDYCTYCQGPRLVEGYRVFRLVHVYFIPLFPTWFLQWRCTSCGQNPGGRRPMPQALAVLGLICGLLGVTTGVWVLHLNRNSHDRESGWGMLALFGALCAVTLYQLIRSNRRREYLAHRNAVVPLPTYVCPYCHATLFARRTTRCEACRVRIE